ncbi:MAG: double-strand break repair protein AddB, partial [Acetobacter sp.]|nr:double-strand break repair protein AddB [Acetobacter sp.]
VDFLALLKHPLVACGLDPKDCRQLARQLEQAALRGAAPPTDLCALKAIHSLKDRIQQNTREKNSLETLINRLEKCFAPIFHWQDSATHPIKIPVPELLTNLIQTAENLAQTNTTEAVSRLWQGEEGHRLSNLFSELIAATAILPAQPYTALNGLLNAVLRQDRTPIHRGDPSGVHPRVFIWELLETRLQTADTVILAGLSEGIWPPAADSGPWLNLAIREKIGLPSPEQKIGQAAHDFCMAVSAAQHVVLSSSNYR